MANVKLSQLHNVNARPSEQAHEDSDSDDILNNRALTVPGVPAFVLARRPVFIRVRRAVRSYRTAIFRYG